MARITVEDCLKQIPNRFELALAATYRARGSSRKAIRRRSKAATSRPSSRCAKSLPARLASRC